MTYTQYLSNEKLHLCLEFYKKLEKELAGTHESVGSCNRDQSAYLCPIGTGSQVTYRSKPENSFRVSDHWNWYANLKKNPDKRYIQCYSRNLPWARKRERPDKASRPITASCVCLFRNGTYEVVYGETYDRTTKQWGWMDSDPAEVAGMIKGGE